METYEYFHLTQQIRQAVPGTVSVVGPDEAQAEYAKATSRSGIDPADLDLIEALNLLGPLGWRLVSLDTSPWRQGIDLRSGILVRSRHSQD